MYSLLEGVQRKQRISYLVVMLVLSTSLTSWECDGGRLEVLLQFLYEEL